MTIRCRKIFMVGLTGLVVFLAAPLTVIGGGAGSSAESLVTELRETSPARRASVRARLVEKGRGVVSVLCEAIKEYPTERDENYVTNCILALGEIGPAAREEGTDTLVSMLASSSSRYRYVAAKSLGQVWTGSNLRSEKLQSINGALLAAVYRAQGEAIYGPGLALVYINRISVDYAGVRKKNPESLPASNLKIQITKWCRKNSDRLPPLASRPWRLLLAQFSMGPRTADGEEARKHLLKKKPLEATEPILSVLGADKVERRQWQAHADLLSKITGVALKETGSDDPGKRAELIEKWLGKWRDHLKKHPDKRHTEYSLSRFESLVMGFQKRPTPPEREKIFKMQDVVLSQLQSPDQLPEKMSDQAKALLAPPLRKKASFKSALKALKEGKMWHERRKQLEQMIEVAESQIGKDIAAQYLDGLKEQITKEENKQVLNEYSRLLRTVTSVPIRFSSESAEQRVHAFEKWREKVEEHGAPKSGD
ncbi:MAG: hypothetical protein ACLFWL_09370 [Candidatus Brocadiia bacterium]